MDTAEDETTGANEEGEGDEAAAGTASEFDFGDLKKKKKKAKKGDMAAFEAELREEEDEGDDQSKPVTDVGAEEDNETMDASDEGQNDANGSWLGSNRDYTYQEVCAFWHL